MNGNYCIKLNGAVRIDLHQFLLLEIRNKSQFSICNLLGAVKIPFEWLMDKLSSFSLRNNIILIGERNADKTEQVKQLLNKYAQLNFNFLNNK